MKKRILSTLLLCLLLTGCGHIAPKQLPEPTPSQTPVVTPSPTPSPTAIPTPTPTPPPEVPDETLVNVQDYLPGVYVDLRYATPRNSMGRAVYDFTEALLRYGTVKKLAVAADLLAAEGYALLIWDAYRPVEAQFHLWEICPDNTYVANPYTGFSNHSRGNTVDITLVTLDGAEVEMPSGFDEFSALADREYSDVSEEAAAHANLLEQAMTAAGFVPYIGEWWHYEDSVRYEVVQ